MKNYGLMYSLNSLEHLARQTARRYCEKQFAASGNRKDKKVVATPSAVWTETERTENTAQSGGLLFWKQLADDISRYNRLYKDNGETVNTKRKVTTGEISAQSVDMITTAALENASIDNSTAADFVSECFAYMLAAYRELEQFAEHNKIILTSEQCRLYLIKQGAKGCYQIQKQEFPRHMNNYNRTYIYITDINEQADLQAADDFAPIFDNAVLADLYSVLNEREQLVIKEHYILGYSYKAIAEQHKELFTNKHAVEVLSTRCIKKMQEYAKAHKITA